MAIRSQQPDPPPNPQNCHCFRDGDVIITRPAYRPPLSSSGLPRRTSFGLGSRTQLAETIPINPSSSSNPIPHHPHPVRAPYTQWVSYQEKREAHDTCGAKPSPRSPILPRSLATRGTLLARPRCGVTCCRPACGSHASQWVKPCVAQMMHRRRSLAYVPSVAVLI